MACERYREALADMAAGAPRTDDLEAHVASCGACRDELAALRQAVAAAEGEMRAILSAEPSPDLAVRIRRTAAEQGPSPVRRLGWTWPALAAAAVALIVAVALLAGREQPRPGVAGVSPQPVGGDPIAEPGGTLERAPGGEHETPPGATSRVQEERVPAGSRLARRRAIPPEVRIPPGETEALLRFAASLQSRTVPPDSLLVSDLSAPLPEPKAIEIEPLEIVPLDPAETSGTD